MRGLEIKKNKESYSGTMIKFLPLDFLGVSYRIP